MKCEDCNHWDSLSNSDSDIKDDIRVCFKAKELWNCTEWLTDNEPDEINGRWVQRKLTKEFKDQKMFVQDGSSYSARLLTKFDFYCAHYEKRCLTKTK